LSFISVWWANEQWLSFEMDCTVSRS